MTQRDLDNLELDFTIYIVESRYLQGVYCLILHKLCRFFDKTTKHKNTVFILQWALGGKYIWTTIEWDWIDMTIVAP